MVGENTLAQIQLSHSLSRLDVFRSLLFNKLAEACG